MGNAGSVRRNGGSAPLAFYRQPRPEPQCRLREESGAARVTRVLLVSVGCLLLFVIVLFFVAILKEDRTGMFYDVVCALLFACHSSR